MAQVTQGLAVRRRPCFPVVVAPDVLDAVIRIEQGPDHVNGAVGSHRDPRLVVLCAGSWRVNDFVPCPKVRPPSSDRETISDDDGGFRLNDIARRYSPPPQAPVATTGSPHSAPGPK